MPLFDSVKRSQRSLKQASCLGMTVYPSFQPFFEGTVCMHVALNAKELWLVTSLSGGGYSLNQDKIPLV